MRTEEERHLRLLWPEWLDNEEHVDEELEQDDETPLRGRIVAAWEESQSMRGGKPLKRFEI